MVEKGQCCPKPKAQSPKPKAQSPKPKAQSPKPKAQSPKPKAQSPKPKAQSPKPKAQSPKPKAQSPKPKAQSPKPKAQSPKPKAQSPKPKAQSPKPKAQSPDSALKARKTVEPAIVYLYRNLLGSNSLFLTYVPPSDFPRGVRCDFNRKTPLIVLRYILGRAVTRCYSTRRSLTFVCLSAIWVLVGPSACLTLLLFIFKRL
ncbi:hypothetical protein JGUZn3_07890 [Entomobacter blattae]|uniref:Uncharacterized protein n=1 Tax=Entomobacter blattae TaxID=2762277 RepID=A0A7H1NQG2_9PROT|nr:hypothetical protein JGUZn3_07890 [Entomobacter blattae]